jgi:hypothetical protein
MIYDESAFPRPASIGNDYVTGEEGVVVDPQQGMTLRDYFAAKAMQAMIESFRIVNHRNPLIDGDVSTMEPNREMILDRNTKTGECDGAAEIAADAYAIADAMLKKRNER